MHHYMFLIDFVFKLFLIKNYFWHKLLLDLKFFMNFFRPKMFFPILFYQRFFYPNIFLSKYLHPDIFLPKNLLPKKHWCSYKTASMNSTTRGPLYTGLVLWYELEVKKFEYIFKLSHLSIRRLSKGLDTESLDSINILQSDKILLIPWMPSFNCLLYLVEIS